MDDAKYIFDQIKNYNDIKNLIGQQEHVLLDFKTTNTTQGKLLPEDKKHFAIAASGFAHQEGGLVIWGIDARKNANEIDEAIGLKPIPNFKRYAGELNSFIKNATAPILSGIKIKTIANSSSPTEGFIVCYFPKSDLAHQINGHASYSFYSRHGDSFVPLSASDIKNLFFRTRSPKLELKIEIKRDLNLHIHCSLINKGPAPAKHVQCLIKFDPNLSPEIYDNEGGRHWKNCTSTEMSAQREFRFSITLNDGLLIYPEIIFELATISFYYDPYPTVMKYKLLAENMEPVDGEFTI